MALAICRANTRPVVTSPFFQSLSSTFSTVQPPADDSTPASAAPQPQQNPTASAYLSDVKSSLRQPQQPSSVSQSPPLKGILKQLSEFKQRPSPPPPEQGHRVSWEDIYRRNIPHGENRGKIDWATVKDSMRGLGTKQGNDGAANGDSSPSPKFRSSLGRNMGGNDANYVKSSTVIGGGTGGRGGPLFGKIEGSVGRDFPKTYTYEELGAKLKKFRPEQKLQKGEFSLQELSERLSKLEAEDAEKSSKSPFGDLRQSLEMLVKVDEKKKKGPTYRSNILGSLGATPDYMLQPPKEELLEKYFHPDNMSSQEKMKIELAKVREEFKMNESDCGSARVQVAQLTTKIKHLSSVLHKKDKHSRKGLQEMVQKRKKLLKYLRRTDWDSFCFVLSKLGLRDNPDYKNL